MFVFIESVYSFNAKCRYHRFGKFQPNIEQTRHTEKNEDFFSLQMMFVHKKTVFMSCKAASDKNKIRLLVTCVSYFLATLGSFTTLHMCLMCLPNVMCLMCDTFMGLRDLIRLMYLRCLSLTHLCYIYDRSSKQGVIYDMCGH